MNSERRHASSTDGALVAALPRVLLADDQPEMRRTVAQLLEDEFDVVAAVGDGQLAVELAFSLVPDIVVLDIGMPVMNGIEAASRLKELGAAGKVVVLTVYEDPDMVEAALSAGATAYVLKASLVDDLIPAIHNAMAGNIFISPSLRRHEK